MTESLNNAADFEANPARRLTLCYVLALSLVAAFVVGSQIWLQQTMASMEENARVINIAGRQRMLSQKITKAVLLSEHLSDASLRKANLQELTAAFNEWTDAHRMLSMKYQLNEKLRSAYFNLNTSFAGMSSVISVILSGGELTAPLLQSIMASEKHFLTQMEEIVGLYEEEVYRLGGLRDMEMLIAAIALLILFCEVVFIFLPLTRLIRGQFESIRDSRAKIEEAREKAEQASSSKTRFISYFSHEIRNPIGVVAGFAGMLKNAELEPATKHRFIDQIVENCEYLTRITKDALDAAAIESGKLRLTPEACDPREVVNRVFTLMEQPAAAKKLHLAFNVVEPVPVEIRTDVTRFRQIMINLISNAIKFTQSGGVFVRMESIGQDMLSIAVIDSGEGMSRSQMSQLFQMFNRLQLVGNESGSGIGLAVSKQLAILLGGDLGVSSLPGQGTTFHLTISTNLRTSGGIQEQSLVAR